MHLRTCIPIQFVEIQEWVRSMLDSYTAPIYMGREGGREGGMGWMEGGRDGGGEGWMEGGRDG